MHHPVQVIGLLKDVFEKAGLGLYLAPYGVLPTAYECGIIEVVPNSQSRSGLGETSGTTLPATLLMVDVRVTEYFPVEDVSIGKPLYPHCICKWWCTAGWRSSTHVA